MRPVLPITLALALTIVPLAGCLDGGPAPPKTALNDSGGNRSTNPNGTGDDPPQGPTPVRFVDGFESGLDGWRTGSDLPDDPNNPGHEVAWNASRNTTQFRNGSASLGLFLDGRQDDGTGWIERNLTLESGKRYNVTLRVWAWSPTASDNTIAHLVLFAGQGPPLDEGSFSPDGWGENRTIVVPGGGKSGEAAHAALRETLNQQAGWRAYVLTWETEPIAHGNLHVAAGISLVWETEVTYFLDDLEVVATPLS